MTTLRGAGRGILVAAWLACAGAAGAGEVGPALAERLAAAPPDDMLRVVVRLERPVPPVPVEAEAHDGAGRAARRAHALSALRDDHARRRKGVTAVVEAAAAVGRSRLVRDLWIGAAVEVEATPDVVGALAGDPDVERVEMAELAAVVTPIEDGAELDDTPPAVYGVRRVRAPQAWSITRGTGAVVAVIDTGFRRSHGDLQGRWRSANGWLDALGVYGAPDDENGHGTHVTGTIVGRNVVGANTIGVAPAAQVIACRAFDASGRALDADLLQCMQWVADPDGNPWTDDAPDVVNASWGFSGDWCGTVFDYAMSVWRSLGIVAVVASGNDGAPHNPANGPAAIAVGAVDRNDAVPWWSGHGPSRCGGDLYPDLVAPGVRVRSAWPGGVRKNLKGTSMAAPHVSGTVALLRSRRPGLGVAEIENILRATAVDLGPAGPDSVYGYGLVDAYRAVLCLDHGSFSGCHAQCP